TLRNAAEEGERTARRYWYVADVNLAWQAWESANVARMRELLRRHIPAEGKEDLRSFDWYYLWRLCHSEVCTLTGHTDRVTGVAFTRAGRTLASAGADGVVRLWALSGGRWREQNSLPKLFPASCLAFSPDGQTLGVGLLDGRVVVWDVAARKPRAVLQGKPK